MKLIIEVEIRADATSSDELEDICYDCEAAVKETIDERGLESEVRWHKE